MRNYKTRSVVGQFKSSFAQKCSECKWLLIIVLSITLVCFIGGIVVFASTPECYPGGEYILTFAGVRGGFGAFFSRTLSIVVVMGVSFACSLTVWTMPLAVILLGFRGYLLGFNIAALCAGFGMSGLLNAILIVIPCQLCMLAALILFLCFSTKTSIYCKKFGNGGRSRWKTILCFFLVLVILNLIETLLLLTFSAKVILVI